MRLSQLRMTELANQVLDLLSSNGYWWRTGKLRSRLGLERPHGHIALRNLLKDMHAKKIVKRLGKGNFEWSINVRTWSRVNPMATPPHSNLLDEEYRPEAEPQGEPEYTPELPEVTYAEEPEEEKVEKPAPAAKADLGPIFKALDHITKQNEKLTDEINSLNQRLEKAEALAKSSVKTLEVKRYDGKVHKLKNVVLPKQFDRVLSLARCRRNVLLVGPAGCGKTHLARLVGDALKLPFGSLSCTAGMSESHLLGRAVPDLSKGRNRFQGTEFLDRYETGGLFLLDELDAADPNLLLAINSALANGYCNVPNRPIKSRADQHADFVCVATANTYGRGANRVYAGRSQLDEATLDRFRIGLVECDYDGQVELVLCPDDGLRTRLQDLRRKVEAAGLRRVVSTRFMRDAYVMKQEADWSDDDVVAVLTSGWTADEKAKVGA